MPRTRTTLWRTRQSKSWGKLSMALTKRELRSSKKNRNSTRRSSTGWRVHRHLSKTKTSYRTKSLSPKGRSSCSSLQSAESKASWNSENKQLKSLTNRCRLRCQTSTSTWRCRKLQVLLGQTLLWQRPKWTLLCSSLRFSRLSSLLRSRFLPQTTRITTRPASSALFRLQR